MGDFFARLDNKLRAFIEEQHIFFTASATAFSRVNLSPKGMDTFRIVDDQTVAYLDLTGSGNETSAHIKHDGRLTIMFCGFASRCLILRLYGRGRVILPSSDEWADFAPRFEMLSGARQIVVLNIESIQTSCGYGVPKYEFIGHRDTLVKWSQKKGDDGIADYQLRKNVQSIDGLTTHLSAKE